MIGESHKMTVQSIVFVIALGGGITYLVDNKAALAGLWASFSSLKDDVRFALAVVCITVTYFFGGMFMAAPLANYVSAAGAQDCPAACDKQVTFDVPASLPKVQIFVAVSLNLPLSLCNSPFELSYSIIDTPIIRLFSVIAERR